LYRLEDIFARQGFEISRATQSVWCGDVADLVEPLYELMAERVRASHVVATDDTIMPMLSKGKVANARMWVYMGDDAHPYNVFDFTQHRGRDGPKYFLKDYRQVLLADAYGGYNGVVAGNQIMRAGCWAHLRRKIIEEAKTAPGIREESVAPVETGGDSRDDLSEGFEALLQCDPGFQEADPVSWQSSRAAKVSRGGRV
jgi:transposase